ncbi:MULTISPECIES: alpha-amylase [unclassified Clostridium]|uniref:alpha-amylase n=1 Tax=unclassified Clostridium TaxID=2614128 RepID=UPI00207AF62D|nr:MULTISPECIES: alpha-amylase [unclassified Clostridium]
MTIEIILIMIVFAIIGGVMYLNLEQDKAKDVEKNEDKVYIEDKKMKNKTMMQYFEWYYPNDGSLWNKVKEHSKKLSKKGITALWLPPAYKGVGGINDVGYGAYDLYDLGEFDQKGTIRTKYGTKEQYLDAINEAHNNNIEVYADTVFNHKAGADESECVKAQLVDSNNRNNIIGEEKEIRSFTVFNFSGRNDKYSSYKWNAKDFDGVDFDDLTKQNGIFKFVGKEWEQDVDDENGNFDFLMCADLDIDSRDVVEELKTWGKWYINECKLDGFRLDAIKHIKFDFFTEWLNDIRSKKGDNVFAVGEYWSGDINKLKYYISKSQNVMSLFDVPLHYKFFEASNLEENFDMRTLTQNTLLDYDEKISVTFVDNHDTEPGQALESWVKPWFKLIAYTFILTRQEGYPCIFYGDYYGIPEKGFEGFKNQLDMILNVRKDYAYGDQCDYFDDKNIIGWTRQGDLMHDNSGVAVLISNGNGGSKRMSMGCENISTTFIDITGNIQEEILIDNEGNGIFKVNNKSYSIWIKK